MRREQLLTASTNLIFLYQKFFLFIAIFCLYFLFSFVIKLSQNTQKISNVNTFKNKEKLNPWLPFNPPGLVLISF